MIKFVEYLADKEAPYGTLLLDQPSCLVIVTAITT